jgi:hypothetical protein
MLPSINHLSGLILPFYSNCSLIYLAGEQSQEESDLQESRGFRQGIHR